MTAPKRLLEEGSSLDRKLLRAARDDRPSDDFERRVIAAAMAPVAPAGPLDQPSLLSRLAVPSLVVVALGAGALMFGRFGAGTPTAPIAPIATPGLPAQPPAPPAPPVVVESEPAIAVTTPDALPSVAAPPIVASAPRSAAAAAPSAVAAIPSATKATSSSLRREVELLDAVKQKLKAGSAADAERALDAYDGEFPQGTLKPESSVLRIRLLLATGQRARAIALTDEVLRRDPNSVHAKRMRALLAADGAEP